MSDSYVPLHVHTELSLLDSCSSFKDYVDFCEGNNIKAIAFTEHGNIYQHFAKRMYCKKKGIKYIHGCEVYLTNTLKEKVRDNYHTVLLAKNKEGYKELNNLIELSTREDHVYYKPRLTFEEFLNISSNIIKISGCLQSPLNYSSDISDDIFDKLCKQYDYFEIQPHNVKEQIEYNKFLKSLSNKYNKPLVATGDFHSVSSYKAECRSILQKAKGIEYSNEDQFDLVIKNYENFKKEFIKQSSLSMDDIEKSLNNTNTIANQCEEIIDDTSIKYPIVSNNDESEFKKAVNLKYQEKVKAGIIPKDKIYLDNIKEEFRVFKKTNMLGFMLFMGQLNDYCLKNNMPRGFCRGSVGGSTIAYILDIIDVNPVKWDTVFSRFCNEYRTEVGDIDIDFAPNDREKVYNYIIDRFGKDKTGYILSLGTISDKGTIDEIGRALKIPLDKVSQIKKDYEKDPEKTKKENPDIFYYFEGLLNTVISQGYHPAGIVASPITLPDNYGVFHKDNMDIMCIDMEEIHECGLVKYDILGLKNIGIIRDCCNLAGIPYPKSYEIDWDDKDVWDDMITSSVGMDKMLMYPLVVMLSKKIG